jgi:hypothetical protein
MHDITLPQNIIERKAYTSWIEPFIRKPVIKSFHRSAKGWKELFAVPAYSTDSE